jgi:NAD(P)H-dependent flavin oxidoreductase YrpB (nitropropane dioxygenase family)
VGVGVPLRMLLCDLLGIDVPLAGAGMGGLAGPEFAAAIGESGALGTIGVGGDASEVVPERLAAPRALTSWPLGVNFVPEVAPVERIHPVFEAGVDALFTGWGDLAPFVGSAHASGTKVVHRVATVAEARTSVVVGVDALVAQGTVVGTRFVAAEETLAHPFYKRRIVEADETKSVLTDVFELGWPGPQHRVLRNSTVESWEAEPEPRWRPAGCEPEILAYAERRSPASSSTRRRPTSRETWRRRRCTRARRRGSYARSSRPAKAVRCMVAEAEAALEVLPR